MWALRGYKRDWIRPDLIAGLTVAVVMMPQAIAYAMIAELPPQMGLYSAIIAAIIGALWGSSKHLHTGPTNAASLLVLASLLTVAPPGSPDFFIAAGYMAIIVGVFRLAMGLLHMGVLVNFVADSVIVGFTAGAGVLISVNQLRHLLRLDISSSPAVGETIQNIAAKIFDVHLLSLLVGIGVIVVMALIKRYRPQLPAALIAMVAASVATGVFAMADHGVVVLGAIPRTLPPLTKMRLLDFALIWKLTPGALAVAAIGLVEAMSIARSVASETGQRLDSNQEFVGQGLASIFTGFFSGYAVSGSFTRTAINFNAGARSPLASVFSGLWVLLFMMVFAPLAVYLPRAALAGVLLVTAWGMVDVNQIRLILRSSRGDTWIISSTFAATILLPLEFAVLAGMLVSFARYLIKTSTPGVYAVVPDEGFHYLVKVGDAAVCPQLGVMEIEGSLYFGAVHHIEEALRKNQEDHPGQIYLLLRMHMVDVCDVSGIHMLEATVRRYRERGGDVFMEGVRPEVLRMIALYGFTAKLGPKNILNEVNAISHLFHKVLQPGICIYQCPVRVFGECQALPKDDHAIELQNFAEMPTHEVHELTPSEVKYLIHDEEDPVTVIDVGEVGEFRNWHIETARSVPLRQLAVKGRDLPKSTGVVFVSRMGRRSQLAVQIMQDMGYERVFSLRGGMLAWEAAGYPIAVE
ncbi:MAG: SulP family sulfate permease [Candidatus Krumholzibacteriia bacterium]|jgi:SulP family sulfate permease